MELRSGRRISSAPRRRARHGTSYYEGDFLHERCVRYVSADGHVYEYEGDAFAPRLHSHSHHPNHPNRQNRPNAAATASRRVALARRVAAWTALLAVLAAVTYLDLASPRLSRLREERGQDEQRRPGGVSAVPLNYLMRFPHVLDQPVADHSASSRRKDGLEWLKGGVRGCAQLFVASF